MLPSRTTALGLGSTTLNTAVQVGLHIRTGDLHQLADQQAVLQLLNLYAGSLPGRMAPLADDVNKRLIPALQLQGNCRLFLAEVSKDFDGCMRLPSDDAVAPVEVDSLAEEGPRLIVGMALCFVGFSTFKARPLLNVHDLTVHPSYQSCGIGGQLLDTAIAFSRMQGYCAVTLEVQASNAARRLYARRGFQVLDGIADEQSTLFGKYEIVDQGSVAVTAPAAID